ncbi:apoptosis-enhancing nuclease-like [Hemicordylus capensis]|uniref:apoptosis-enhancing nuclease-like n=1 Tax=Hemicordylus capensis TaxID=884348 RepID=UPI0023032691|nr:apoptosis-enhancing nuclease-like [Hemicordylus capensis]XP_053129162.1 apoptosis-enhancing nuclease-like [Hemicordylus capensis]
MPSTSIKCAPGGTNLAKTHQGNSFMGMEGLYLECSRWDPGDFLNKALPDAKACRQNKTKSRKHQRFMARRAQEQRKLLGVERPLLISDCSESCTARDRKVSQLAKQDVGKAHKKLNVLGPVVMVSTAREPSSSRDLQSRVALMSGSETSTGSVSCLTTKKPRKCVALDCEMVGTGPVGKTSELARCTVVNYNGDVIYDKYVRPELPIKDYRTRWSGITRRHMEHAIPFRVAQKEISQILREKIVVGHAIHNDFRALKYFHPRGLTRDTSQSPLLKEKLGSPVKGSVSLKNLARELLNKNIQVSKNGHSSVEDARTSMELYRLVEVQWEQELANRHPLSPSSSPPDSGTDIDCYLEDQYWPEDINVDCK